MIPYGRQYLDEDDIAAVVAVLRSDYLTQGPAVPRFETALQACTGAQEAVAVQSATAALLIACRALGVGPGDVVWTSPITFVASANCARMCGAQVDFVDIDPTTFTMCPQHLAEKLAEAERQGRVPKVIIPVHMCGQSCAMADIHALAQRYGCRIIEDASHAIGGRYQDVPIGSCTYSDITVLSFHPVKIITTGEGGAALTNDADLAGHMRDLRSHGITRDPDACEDYHGPWYYEQYDLGYNSRLTDMQAALGCSQLRHLNAFIEARHALAERYDQALADLPVDIPYRRSDSYSAFHLYIIGLRGASPEQRQRLFTFMRAQGIGVHVHYIPVHLQPYYRRLGFAPGDFPQAERYYRTALTLPLFPQLSHAQQDQVIASLADGCHQEGL
ncbi:MAG: UDP-4-amino-4,6-dideoxy-N-acetyl-beta-L-altrosamine transaminase [Planctomycetota bacterium]|nr:MAG: UDP-4-amino-4,6-dideoxy-N-acetyl-beta-L-altrosamine transaminase [Planctomycetota bacterium]